jgi:hypothetical protein
MDEPLVETPVVDAKRDAGSPSSASKLRRRSTFIGNSRRCRQNTGGSQARMPYAMNAMLLKMPIMRKRRISFAMNVKSTIAEAR